MGNWIDINQEEPTKLYGGAYEFCVEIKSNKAFSDYFKVVGIWNGIDWYLLPFKEISGFQNLSGLKYFKVNKPKYWREFKAQNVVF